MDDFPEKDADVKMTYKSDDSSKFDRSFWKVEVFLPQYDHGGSSDVGGLARKIHLEQKSMTGKFDVEGTKLYFFNFFEMLFLDSKLSNMTRLMVYRA